MKEWNQKPTVTEKKNKTKGRKQNCSWQKLKKKAVLWKYDEDKIQWLSLALAILLFSCCCFFIHYYYYHYFDLQKDLQEKFATLPTPEEWTQFVTWPALEDALKGIRDDLTPPERVVIEMSSQTEPGPVSFMNYFLKLLDCMLRVDTRVVE